MKEKLMSLNVYRRTKLRLNILENLNLNRSISCKIKKWLNIDIDELMYMQENSKGHVRDIYDELFFIKLKINPPEIKINTEFCMDREILIMNIENKNQFEFTQYIVEPFFRNITISYFTYLDLTVTEIHPEHYILQVTNTYTKNNFKYSNELVFIPYHKNYYFSTLFQKVQ
jgi:hypothetical protein